MRPEEEDIQLIENYLSGTLDENDQRMIESRLTEDAEFSKRMDAYNILIKGIRISGRKDLIQHLQQLENDLESNETKATKTRKLFPRGLYYLAASVALIAVMIFYIFGGPGHDVQQLAEAYYEPYPATVYITKRSPEEKTAELTNAEEAFHLYQAGDYDKSIQLFEGLSVEDQDEYTRFYLASAYQAIGEFDKAIVLYEGLIEMHGIFKSQSQWYMALCYLFKNDIDASRNVLKRLSTSTDSYGPKALKLLNDIQN